MTPRNNIHAIIMPNEVCNIACTYCYVQTKAKGRMSPSLAKRIIDELLGNNRPDDPTRLIWHGGEPLLAGLDFYEQIAEYISSTYPHHNVVHCIQTNGVLLDDGWVDFFLKHDFKVGVSMDGWRDLHDACRTTIDGKGTFQRIFDNVQRARERGLVIGILAVITRHTLGHEQELFDFFVGHKLDFGFHPITSLTPWMDDVLSITPDEFADVSINLFDLGFRQPEPRVTDVSPSQHYALAVMMGCSTGLCVMSKACAEEYISIEPSGRVHVCDRFAGNSDLALGNLSMQSLSEILDSPVRRVFITRWEALQSQCNSCKWATICYGGCPHEAYAASGSITNADPNCEAYKRIFTHVSNLIHRELDLAEASATNPSYVKDGVL